MLKKILFEDNGKVSEEFVRIKKKQEKEQGDLNEIIEEDNRRPRKSVYDIGIPYWRKPEEEENRYR